MKLNKFKSPICIENECYIFIDGQRYYFYSKAGYMTTIFISQYRSLMARLNFDPDYQVKAPTVNNTLHALSVYTSIKEEIEIHYQGRVWTADEFEEAFSHQISHDGLDDYIPGLHSEPKEDL